MTLESKGWYEFAAMLKIKRDFSILVNDGTKDIWLPRSQIEDPDPADMEEGQTYTILIPEWLAVEKGIV